MKIRIFITALFLLQSQLYGCPACVGSVKRDSPPFFSDEFYEPYTMPTQFALNLTTTMIDILNK